MANIAMFIPFGFFASAMGKACPRKAFPVVILLAISFSALIELSQLFLMRGYFEYDDIFNNVSGTVLGALFFLLMQRFLPNRSLYTILHVVNASILVFCLGLYISIKDSKEDTMTSLSQGLCFQVEDAFAHDDVTELSGVCFWYDRELLPHRILLQSTKSHELAALKTESGLSRPDASAYFHKESLMAGFQASVEGLVENEEYEIIIDFGFFRIIPTDVFLTVQRDSGQKQSIVDIHYIPSRLYVPLKTAGTDLEEIVTKGTLRVYRPDVHVYVYIYEGCLYWIAERGFNYEQDGSTFMNAVLWTTEPEKISDKSKARGIPYDALGVDFERGELTGNFGQYRVCAWKLPTHYPITSIKTGYYRKGWVWEANFWPVFDFSVLESHAGI